MELGGLVRQQTDLIDRERLDPVVFPVIGVRVRGASGKSAEASKRAVVDLPRPDSPTNR